MKEIKFKKPTEQEEPKEFIVDEEHPQYNPHTHKEFLMSLNNYTKDLNKRIGML